jgi:hypothetical protein
VVKRIREKRRKVTGRTVWPVLQKVTVACTRMHFKLDSLLSNYFVNARILDCPVAGQSSIEMNNINDQFDTGIGRPSLVLSSTRDAGMPILEALATILIPCYNTYSTYIHIIGRHILM